MHTFGMLTQVGNDGFDPGALTLGPGPVSQAITEHIAAHREAEQAQASMLPVAKVSVFAPMKGKGVWPVTLTYSADISIMMAPHHRQRYAALAKCTCDGQGRLIATVCTCFWHIVRTLLRMCEQAEPPLLTANIQTYASGQVATWTS
jgi:hypothetical protein